MVEKDANRNGAPLARQTKPVDRLRVRRRRLRRSLNGGISIFFDAMSSIGSSAAAAVAGDLTGW
jgi:hypothetical protein